MLYQVDYNTRYCAALLLLGSLYMIRGKTAMPTDNFAILIVRRHPPGA